MLVPIATGLAWPLPPPPLARKSLGEHHLSEGRCTPWRRAQPQVWALHTLEDLPWASRVWLE